MTNNKFELPLKYFLHIALLLLTVLFSFCSNETKSYSDSFDSGFINWSTNSSSDWDIISVNGDNVLHLKKPGKMGTFRAPASRAILLSQDVTDFEFTVRAQCLTDTLNKRRDICLFFGYQDSTHYYYAHFSGVSDKFHNIIAIVNNSDRTKINIEKPGESNAQLTGPGWYNLRVVRDSVLGEINAYVNDNPVAAMTAKDTTFGAGKIGFGSFDDTVYFTDVILKINKKNKG